MADGDETTVIGADSHFNGELKFEKTAKIVGRFDGAIVGKGELNVAQSATCKANIEANNATIDGTVEGNVSTRDTVRLNANSVIRGDIVAAKMVMAEGASFSGRCEIGGNGKGGGERDRGGSGGGSGGSGGSGGGGGGGGGNSGPQPVPNNQGGGGNKK